MELKIYNPSEEKLLQKIEFNYEELKQGFTKIANDYMNLVVTVDQVKVAKTDRANLRKLRTALNDEKKRVKNQIMAPYIVFDEQIKELMSILDKAIDNIDIQIKGYDEAQRNEKLAKVKEIYKECIGDLDRLVPFEKIFKESWLNVSTSQKSIKEEISGIYEKVDKELKLINADGSHYVFEMKEEYLKNFDLTSAMAVKQKLEETERKKAEFEAKRKQEEEEYKKRMQQEAKMIAEAGTKKQTASDISKAAEEISGADDVVHNLKRKRLTIQITANEEQFDYLNRALADLMKNSEKLEILKKEEL